jgi:hypothetical protein
MISFNDRTGGKDAVALTQHLLALGIATFCTRLWCPRSLGSWADHTATGARKCKTLVGLVTDGWCESSEVKAEMNIILARWKHQRVNVLLVRYSSELKDADPGNMLINILAYFAGNQDVYHDKYGTNEANADWMEDVAKLIRADGVSRESATTPQKGDAEPGALSNPALKQFKTVAALPTTVPGLPEMFSKRQEAIALIRLKLLASGDAVVISSKNPINAEVNMEHAGQSMGFSTAADITANSRVAAHGPGGVGKTILAAAAVRDLTVRQAFSRIAWVSVGQQPKISQLQRQLYTQLTGEA